MTHSIKNVALTTGLSLVGMAVIAGASMVGMLGSVLSDDPAMIGDILLSGHSNFSIEVLGWVFIVVFDVIAAWGLYVVFKDRFPLLSSLTAILRLIYAAILAMGVGFLVYALFISSDLNNHLDTAHLAGHSIIAFREVWNFGLIIFGFHLLGLAPLVWGQGLIRKSISVLILIAGIGYLIINIAHLVMFDDTLFRASAEAIFMLPMILGEVGLAIWLIVFGLKRAEK